MIKNFNRISTNRIEVEVEFPYPVFFSSDFALEDLIAYFYIRSNYNPGNMTLYTAHSTIYRILENADFYSASLESISQGDGSLKFQLEFPTNFDAEKFFEYLKKKFNSQQ